MTDPAVGRRARWLGVFALLVIVTISYVDRINVSVLGVRRGLLLSLLSWLLCTLASPYAAGAAMLVALRALLGAGEAPL